MSDLTAHITWYEDGFRTAFDTGTAITWDILFTENIGGNFNPDGDRHIYLTATNRAALGCEGLVAYSGNTAPSVAVYDRRIGKFVFPVTQLANSAIQRYVWSWTLVKPFHLQALTIVNKTYEDTTPDTWINEVYLPGRNGLPDYPLYKSAPYNATVQAQKAKFKLDGTWGPTLEPDDDVERPYQGTSPAGWANASLASRDRNGMWGAFELLKAEQSRIKESQGRFRVQHADPNHAAVLTSP